MLYVGFGVLCLRVHLCLFLLWPAAFNCKIHHAHAFLPLIYPVRMLYVGCGDRLTCICIFMVAAKEGDKQGETSTRRSKHVISQWKSCGFVLGLAFVSSFLACLEIWLFFCLFIRLRFDLSTSIDRACPDSQSMRNSFDITNLRARSAREKRLTFMSISF